MLPHALVREENIHTLHRNDFVVVNIHCLEAFEMDFGLAIEVDVEGLGAHDGFCVFGEGVQGGELDILLNGDLSLCF